MPTNPDHPDLGPKIGDPDRIVTWSYEGSYTDTIATMHSRLRPRAYVEVGVFRAKTLCLVEPETVAIGIDPEPQIARPLTRNTQVFALTSDDFFARKDVLDILERRSVDLAFIDGMHLFEYAFRDFRNLERLCTRESVVLIHDCLPPTSASAARVRTEGFWTGDVWKLLVCLQERRPDLSISVIAASPSGLGLISNLDPESDLLWNDEEDCLNTYAALDYDDFLACMTDHVDVIPNDWNAIRPLVPSEPWQPHDPSADPIRRWPRTPRAQARRARVWFSETRAAAALKRLVRL